MKIMWKRPERDRSYLVTIVAALLTPAYLANAALIPSDASHVKSLDGVWRFKIENTGALTTGRQKISDADAAPEATDFVTSFQPQYREDTNWHNLKLPSNWEMAGYSPATYNEPDRASGLYRRWFKVPRSWRNRRVLIQFEGVQNGAEVYCNGKPVTVTECSWGKINYHEGGWLPFQADITPVANFGGKNLLAVRVTKKTKSVELDTGDYFFLGGIHRGVSLFSVPTNCIEDLTIHTDLRPDGSADVRVESQISSAAGNGYRVSTKLEPRTKVSEGPSVLMTSSTIDDTGHVALTNHVKRPQLWSAEHPNLYNLTIQLKDGQGKVVETLGRRVGIREVSIENGVYCMNHVPVKLTGICRHDASIPLGTAANEDLWRKDILLAKAANVNSIRTSHYPYGQGFYDLCDELGIYVMDELPYCWCSNQADDTAYLPAFEQRARETLSRDKNHASVVLWAIGNENKAGKNLQVISDLVKKTDPSRPHIVSQFGFDKYNTEISDSHYTAPAQIARAAEKARQDGVPHMYLECPNVWDISLGANEGGDAGCWDLWEQVLRRTWDVVWANDSIPGAFLWEWQDRDVADTCPTKLVRFDKATGIDYLKIKGVTDGYRHPRPQYYNVKMIYSPIQVGRKADVSENEITFLVTNRFSFTDLREIDCKWRLLRKGKTLDSGSTHAPLPPLKIGSFRLPLSKSNLGRADVFEISFVHPDGREIVSHRFHLTEPAALRPAASLPGGLKFPSLNLVINKTVKVPNLGWRRADRFHGNLANLRIQPGSAADEEAIKLSQVQTLDADIVFTNNTSLKGHVHAALDHGRFSYRIDWDSPKADVQELGWIFEMPKAFDRFSWNRDGTWTVYPKDHIGRNEGTATPDSARVNVLDWERPDAFDFNSTKYNCNSASLTDRKGKGLAVAFDSTDRHQCRGGFAGDGGYTLIVNRQTSPPQDISSNVVPDLYQSLKKGDHIEGAFDIGAAREKQ
jgi:beta-galactosidase